MARGAVGGAAQRGRVEFDDEELSALAFQLVEMEKQLNHPMFRGCSIFIWALVGTTIVMALLVVWLAVSGNLTW